MKIDRTNYEIWLIDWLDGNLSDQQVKQIKLFLDENPDIRAESDEMKLPELNPLDKIFPLKDNLKKSTTDLAVPQFEYLCVAYLENDLSADQQSELREMTTQEPEKKKTFELIQKMRLTPAGIGYKNKNQLIKKPQIQRIIKLSLIGLSAAASIALLIMTYLAVPRNLQQEIINTAQNTAVDNSLPRLSADIVSESIVPENNPVLQKIKTVNALVASQNKDSLIAQSDFTVTLNNDSLPNLFIDREIQPLNIPLFSKIDLRRISVNNTLISFNTTFIIPAYDERSNISKFIAKTFREKILKENISKDSPLKGYEIAEAGITGLNKLFGWEMALDKTTDENGEPQSVYFSSKILNFNTPVKKTEQLP